MSVLYDSISKLLNMQRIVDINLLLYISTKGDLFIKNGFIHVFDYDPFDFGTIRKTRIAISLKNVMKAKISFNKT